MSPNRRRSASAWPSTASDAACSEGLRAPASRPDNAAPSDGIPSLSPPSYAYGSSGLLVISYRYGETVRGTPACLCSASLVWAGIYGPPLRPPANSAHRESAEAQVQGDAALLALQVLVQRGRGQPGGQRRDCSSAAKDGQGRASVGQTGAGAGVDEECLPTVMCDTHGG